MYGRFPVLGSGLFEKYGDKVDPWMTLVGYFNSMRELGGMRRLDDDGVLPAAASKIAEDWKRRYLQRRVPRRTDESHAVRGDPEILDRLEKGFDPKLDELRKEAFKTRTTRISRRSRSMYCWRRT